MNKIIIFDSIFLKRILVFNTKKKEFIFFSSSKSVSNKRTENLILNNLKFFSSLTLTSMDKLVVITPLTFLELRIVESFFLGLQFSKNVFKIELFFILKKILTFQPMIFFIEKEKSKKIIINFQLKKISYTSNILFLLKGLKILNFNFIKENYVYNIKDIKRIKLLNKKLQKIEFLDFISLFLFNIY